MGENHNIIFNPGPRTGAFTEGTHKQKKNNQGRYKVNLLREIELDHDREI